MNKTYPSTKVSMEPETGPADSNDSLRYQVQNKAQFVIH